MTALDRRAISPLPYRCCGRIGWHDSGCSHLDQLDAGERRTTTCRAGVNATHSVSHAKGTHDGRRLTGPGVPAPALHLTNRAWWLITAATCTGLFLFLLLAAHIGQENRCHRLRPSSTAFHTYCAPEATR